ncbi:unnamed protein product [Gemmataceae bacterium]|nr:unnamed protein product [Gemmataceae bacterium]VTU00889.1 unnamed protein product [Gemmataceae bacterium]
MKHPYLVESKVQPHTFMTLTADTIKPATLTARFLDTHDKSLFAGTTVTLPTRTIRTPAGLTTPSAEFARIRAYHPHRNLGRVNRALLRVQSAVPLKRGGSPNILNRSRSSQRGGRSQGSHVSGIASAPTG